MATLEYAENVFLEVGITLHNNWRLEFESQEECDYLFSVNYIPFDAVIGITEEEEEEELGNNEVR